MNEEKSQYLLKKRNFFRVKRKRIKKTQKKCRECNMSINPIVTFYSLKELFDYIFTNIVISEINENIKKDILSLKDKKINFSFCTKCLINLCFMKGLYYFNSINSGKKQRLLTNVNNSNSNSIFRNSKLGIVMNNLKLIKQSINQSSREIESRIERVCNKDNVEMLHNINETRKLIEKKKKYINEIILNFNTNSRNFESYLDEIKNYKDNDKMLKTIIKNTTITSYKIPNEFNDMDTQLLIKTKEKEDDGKYIPKFKLSSKALISIEDNQNEFKNKLENPLNNTIKNKKDLLITPIGTKIEQKMKDLARYNYAILNDDKMITFTDFYKSNTGNNEKKINIDNIDNKDNFTSNFSNPINVNNTNNNYQMNLIQNINQTFPTPISYPNLIPFKNLYQLKSFQNTIPVSYPSNLPLFNSIQLFPSIVTFEDKNYLDQPTKFDNNPFIQYSQNMQRKDREKNYSEQFLANLRDKDIISNYKKHL